MRLKQLKENNSSNSPFEDGFRGMTSSNSTTKGGFKAMIPLFIIAFINLLFAYKYGIRATSLALPISLIYIFVFLFIPKLSNSIFDKYKMISPSTILLIILGLFVGIHIAGFNIVPVGKLNVDRWQIITGFWDSVKDGVYPYYPRTPDANPPGPMPLYFVFAYPFYLIGEIGFYSLLGVLLFAIFTYRNINDKRSVLIINLLLIASLSINWEIVSRSTILINSVLMLILMDYLLTHAINNWKNLLISAIISGLLLSTRSIFILMFIVIILYKIRSKELSLMQSALWFSIAMIAYLLPLGFFALIYPHDFWRMNPLIVQSEFLIPPYFVGIFILIALVLGIRTQTLNGVYLSSAIALFSAILIYCCYHIATSGFETAYINSKADISYFIFCIPFLLFYLGFREKTELNQKTDN